MSDEFDDFDDFDLDDDVKESGSDREPVEGALKEGAESFKESLLEDDEIGKKAAVGIGKTLATNLVGDKTVSRLTETTGSFVDEFEKSVSEIRKESRPIAKAIRSISPDQDSVVGQVTHKLADIIGGEEGEGGNSGEQSYDELLSERVNSALSSLTLNREKDEIDKELATEAMKFKQMNDQITLLQSIATDMSSSSNFLRKSTLEFYKKQLELQYKQVFISGDIRNILASGFDRLGKEQDIIAKNTALPDFVKMRSSEALHAAIRQKMHDSMIQTFIGKNDWMDNLKRNILGRFNASKDKIKDSVTGISGIIQDIEEANSQLEDAGMSKSSMAGDLAGDAVKEKGFGVIGRALAKSPFARKITGDLIQMSTSMPEYLDKVSNKHGDNVIGKTASFFRDLMRNPLESTDTGLGVGGLDQPTIFDGRTKTSIVTVIPGLLAKILNSVEKLKNKNAETLHFNYTKGKFERESAFDRSFDEEVKLKMFTSGGVKAIDTFVSKLQDNVGKKSTLYLDPKEVRNFKRILYKYVMSNNSLNPEYFEDAGLYDNMNPVMATKIRGLIKRYLYKDGSLNQERFDSLSTTLRSASSGIFNPTKFLEDKKDSGEIEFLEKKGLVKFDPHRQEYVLDMKKYLSYSEGFVNSVGSQGYEDYLFNRNVSKENEETINKSEPTSLLDVVKAAKDDIKKIDPDKAKDATKKGFKKFVKTAKDLDEKVANMSKSDWSELGIDTKNKALKFITDNYDKNVSDEYKKKIDESLNYVFNSKGYTYLESKIKDAHSYLKDNDRKSILDDLHRLKRKGLVKSRKFIKTVKALKVEDLKFAGINTYEDAVKHVTGIYGDHDIKTLKKIEKILQDKYDDFNKDETQNYFSKKWNKFKSRLRGEKSRVISKFNKVLSHFKGWTYDDFDKLGITNANDAVRHILNTIDFTPTKKEMRQLYDTMSNIFTVRDTVNKTNDFVSNKKSSFKKTFDKKKQEVKDNVKKPSWLDSLLKKEDKKLEFWSYLTNKFKREEKEKKEKKKRSFFDKDGDGKRNGSWMEYFERKGKKKDKEPTKKEIEEKDKKSGGLFSMLGSIIKFATFPITKTLGGIFSGLSGVKTILGGLGSMLGGIAGGLGFAPLKLGWWATKNLTKGLFGLTKIIGKSALGSAKVLGSGVSGISSLVSSVIKGGKSPVVKKSLKLLGKFVKYVPVIGPILALGLDFGLDYFFDDAELPEDIMNPNGSKDNEVTPKKVVAKDTTIGLTDDLKPYKEKMTESSNQYRKLLSEYQNEKDDKKKKELYGKLEQSRKNMLKDVKTYQEAYRSKQETGKVSVSNKDMFKPVSDPAGYAGKKLTGLAKTSGTITRIVEAKNNYASAHILKGESWVSFGAYQFIEKFGHIRNVLTILLKKKPKYEEELKTIIRGFGKDGMYQGSREYLISFLKRIGFTPESIHAQDEYFYKEFFLKGQKIAHSAGLKDNYTVLHIIDHYHNAGPMAAKTVAKATAKVGDTLDSAVNARINWYRSKNSNYVQAWVNRVNKVSKLMKGLTKGTDYKVISPETYNQTYTSSDSSTTSSNDTTSTGMKSRVLDGIKGIVEMFKEMFGFNQEATDSLIGPDAVEVETSSSTTDISNNPLRRNNATKFNPLIHDWKTSKRYDSLNETAQEFFAKFSHFVEPYGIKLMIPKYGGNRHPDNQKHLYAIGRTIEKHRKPVTWTLKSKHIGGAAIDIISLKGFKDVKTNASIAKLMRAFADANPEFQAHFLNIEKDPNHVDFPKSKKIRPINVEAEIDGVKNPKEEQKKIEEAYTQTEKAKSVKSSPYTGTSLRGVIIPEDHRLENALGNKKSPTTKKRIPASEYKGMVSSVITNVPPEVSEIEHKKTDKKPVVTQQTNPHTFNRQLKEAKQAVQTHVKTTDTLEKYIDRNGKTLINIHSVLVDIYRTNLDMLKEMKEKGSGEHKHNDKDGYVAYDPHITQKKKKPRVITEPSVGVDTSV